MLLEHDKNYTVVKSRQTGVLQHNGLTWEVEGNRFVHMKDVSGECVRTDRNLQEWIRGMTPEQREQFSEAIYQILSADNALTLTQLMSPKNRWLLQSLKLDPEVRKTIHRTLRELIGINAKNLFSAGSARIRKGKPNNKTRHLPRGRCRVCRLVRFKKRVFCRFRIADQSNLKGLDRADGVSAPSLITASPSAKKPSLPDRRTLVPAGRSTFSFRSATAQPLRMSFS